jgi:predicted CopG family antitoxin
MSTSSIRIKNDVYSRLELNAKGYESVSDTINRANACLEMVEALGMLDRQVAFSVQDLIEDNITKERTILMHFKEEAITSAMDIVVRLYPEYHVKYEIKVNMCCITVSLRGGN